MTIIYKSFNAPYMENYGTYQCHNCRSVIGEKPANGEFSNQDYSKKITFECPVCGAENTVNHGDYLQTIADYRLMISHDKCIELNPYKQEEDKTISLDKYYLNQVS